jgi:NitT/TauT family transport system ATP-binding protein
VCCSVVTPCSSPDRKLVLCQSPTLLEWLSVIDNVLLPITIARPPKATEVARAVALLATMGLTEYQRHYPRQLSGGQQSRVAIARALILEPALLLMDEPFAALDAITREDLQNDLAAMCRERQTTVFFVTHDIAEAVYLADRVAVMADGQLRQDVKIDLPAERTTATRYSARFNSICADLRSAMDAVPA